MRKTLERHAKPHWTLNKANLRRAIQEDKHPASLLAIELIDITPNMDWVEGMRIANLIIKLV